MSDITVFAHLFLPEENAAPFPSLAWIPLICNPVRKQGLQLNSRTQCPAHTTCNLGSTSVIPMMKHKFQVSQYCPIILQKVHFVHVDSN